jgi:hypothetical protein
MKPDRSTYIEGLALKLDKIRAQQRALEEQNENIKDELISMLGVGTTSTPQYKVTISEYSRMIFNKEKFVELFGEQVYPRVTRDITVTQIYLTRKEAAHG